MHKISKSAEDLACSYLEEQGLSLITANYSCKLGEIDLIMKDQDVLVFVEVRYRKDSDYGDGAETITRFKQNKIKKAATFYLQENDLYDKVPCRFDVVSVSGSWQEKFCWIKDAFWNKW